MENDRGTLAQAAAITTGAFAEMSSIIVPWPLPRSHRDDVTLNDYTLRPISCKRIVGDLMYATGLRKGVRCS